LKQWYNFSLRFISSFLTLTLFLRLQRASAASLTDREGKYGNDASSGMATVDASTGENIKSSHLCHFLKILITKACGPVVENCYVERRKNKCGNVLLPYLYFATRLLIRLVSCSSGLFSRHFSSFQPTVYHNLRPYVSKN
jgi:hypothetical protein